MKILVASGDYDSCFHTQYEIKDQFVREFINLIDAELLACGDFESEERSEDVIETLTSMLRSEQTLDQAITDYDEYQENSKKKKYVVFSGYSDPRGWMDRETYLQYFEGEMKPVRARNKQIKDLIERYKNA